MVEGQEEEEGGRRRAEGRPPPRSPHGIALGRPTASPSVASRLGSEGGSVQERERRG